MIRSSVLPQCTQQNETYVHAITNTTLMSEHAQSSGMHSSVGSHKNLVQAVRFLLSNFAETLRQDPSFEPSASLEKARSVDIRQLKSYPPTWGTLRDNSSDSPLAWVHDLPEMLKADSQMDITLLTSPGQCTMKRLFAAAGGVATFGYQLHQHLHELFVWPVPYADFYDDAVLDFQNESDIDAADDPVTNPTGATTGPAVATAAETEGNVTDDTTLPGVTVAGETDVEVPLPRQQLNVAGVFMLLHIVPWVVRITYAAGKDVTVGVS